MQGTDAVEKTKHCGLSLTRIVMESVPPKVIVLWLERVVVVCNVTETVCIRVTNSFVIRGTTSKPERENIVAICRPKDPVSQILFTSGTLPSTSSFLPKDD